MRKNAGFEPRVHAPRSKKKVPTQAVDAGGKSVFHIDCEPDCRGEETLSRCLSLETLGTGCPYVSGAPSLSQILAFMCSTVSEGCVSIDGRAFRRDAGMNAEWEE